MHFLKVCLVLQQLDLLLFQDLRKYYQKVFYCGELILQWLGGIGIIVMAITLMPIMNVGGMQLFKISSNDTSEKILPKSKEIAMRLIYIYLFLTLTFMCFSYYKYLA